MRRASLKRGACYLNGDLLLRLTWIWIWVCVCFLVLTMEWRSNHTYESSFPPLCPPCHCSCSSSHYSLDSLASFIGCGKNDPVMHEEMKKDMVTLLSEEVRLQEVVAKETLEQTKKEIGNARKASSHYQKEAEKCNLGIKTCEEARERVEAELVFERRLSALWEKRARQFGWIHTTNVNVTRSA